MMILAKLSTAKTIVFGPVLDADGAEYTGAVVGDVKICKNNGTPAALNGSATLTHKQVGLYELVLTTSDISEVGVITVVLSKTTYVAPPISINVLPAKVYDSLVAGTDNLEVDIVQILGMASAGAAGSVQADNVAAIKAKTDNLPTDPADASDISASFVSIASTLTTIAAYIDTEVAAIKTKTDQLTFTTVNKLDAKLTSDGLDLISTTAPSGVATNFREMTIQLWRRFFKKATKTSTEIKTYADNGTDVVTTQTISEGVTETQGAAS